MRRRGPTAGVSVPGGRVASALRGFFRFPLRALRHANERVETPFYTVSYDFQLRRAGAAPAIEG